jgi:hypothetical protein
MKKKYKFIYFTHVEWTDDSGKPLRGWFCCNNKTREIIGRIGYHAGWRKWVYSSAGTDIVYDEQCLTDITHFLKQIDKEGKNGKTQQD